MIRRFRLHMISNSVWGCTLKPSRFSRPVQTSQQQVTFPQHYCHQWSLSSVRFVHTKSPCPEVSNKETLDDLRKNVGGHLNHQPDGNPSNKLFLFREGGKWPQLDDPTTTLAFSPDEHLKFVARSDSSGRWCLEPKLGERMVRRQYSVVWERLQAHLSAGTHMLINGNAGIGKSLLLDLLLSWSLFTQPHLPIIVITARGLSVFCKIGGDQKRFHVRFNELYPSPEQMVECGILKEGDQLLVLHDIKTATSLRFEESVVEELDEFFQVTCVVASSPLESNFVRFQKDFAPTQLVLPPLSHDEAKALVRQQQGVNFNEATFDHWFENVGGIPRHLQSAATVEAAVRAQKFAALTVQFDPALTAASNESGKIVAMRSDAADLESNIWFDFVSQNAWRVWREAQATTKAPVILQRLRQARDDNTRDVYGRYFESWFLSLLEEGGVLCRQRLESKSVHNIQRWELPDARLKVTRFWGKSASAIRPVDEPTLYIPLDGNFPVVDAVIAWKKCNKYHASLVQVTVADNHNPKSNPMRELLGALEHSGFDQWDMTWVVDPQSKLASRQDVDGPEVDDWKKVPQYVCRIDDLMCWVCEQGQKKPTESSVSFPLNNVGDDEAILQEVKARVDSKAIAIKNFKTIRGPCSMGTPFRYSTKRSKK